MLGVPRCFDDQTAEAAAAMGSLIAEADAASSGATTETAANAAVHPLSTEARWYCFLGSLPAAPTTVAPMILIKLSEE